MFLAFVNFQDCWYSSELVLLCCLLPSCHIENKKYSFCLSHIIIFILSIWFVRSQAKRDLVMCPLSLSLYPYLFLSDTNKISHASCVINFIVLFDLDSWNSIYVFLYFIFDVQCSDLNWNCILSILYTYGWCIVFVFDIHIFQYDRKQIIHLRQGRRRVKNDDNSYILH